MEQLNLDFTDDRERAEQNERDFHFICGDFAGLLNKFGSTQVMDYLYINHRTSYNDLMEWFEK